MTEKRCPHCGALNYPATVCRLCKLPLEDLVGWLGGGITGLLIIAALAVTL